MCISRLMLGSWLACVNVPYPDAGPAASKMCMCEAEPEGHFLPKLAGCRVGDGERAACRKGSVCTTLPGPRKEPITSWGLGMGPAPKGSKAEENGHFRIIYQHFIVVVEIITSYTGIIKTNTITEFVMCVTWWCRRWAGWGGVWGDFMWRGLGRRRPTGGLGWPSKQVPKEVSGCGCRRLRWRTRAANSTPIEAKKVHFLRRFLCCWLCSGWVGFLGGCAGIGPLMWQGEHLIVGGLALFTVAIMTSVWPAWLCRDRNRRREKATELEMVQKSKMWELNKNELQISYRKHRLVSPVTGDTSCSALCYLYSVLQFRIILSDYLLQKIQCTEKRRSTFNEGTGSTFMTTDLCCY